MIVPNIVTLAANEVREMACSGTYFELRTAAASVDLIELLDRSGGVVSLLDDAESTDYVRTARPFETVRLTNGATPQAVKFYYGDGESGSNRFTGVVSGEVSLAAATLAALESVSLNAATLADMKSPPAYTGSYNDAGGALAANTPYTVFTPAANVNGAIILKAQIHDVGSTMGLHAFLGKASAPASVSDGVPVLTASIIGGYSTVAVVEAQTVQAFYLPAGIGLYYITSVAAGGNTWRSAAWRLL